MWLKEECNILGKTEMSKKNERKKKKLIKVQDIKRNCSEKRETFEAFYFEYIRYLYYTHYFYFPFFY